MIAGVGTRRLRLSVPDGYDERILRDAPQPDLRKPCSDNGVHVIMRQCVPRYRQRSKL